MWPLQDSLPREGNGNVAPIAQLSVEGPWQDANASGTRDTSGDQVVGPTQTPSVQLVSGDLEHQSRRVARGSRLVRGAGPTVRQMLGSSSTLACQASALHGRFPFDELNPRGRATRHA
jgi:hypothetical protein